MLASQATQRAGLPSAAAPAPLSIGDAVAVEQHPESRRSSAVDGGEAAAEHDPRRRGVVRDGVGERDPPVRDPAVDDLDRRQHAARSRRAHRPSVTPGTGEVASPCTKAISASTRGCSSVVERDLVAVVDEHVVEQHAEVGLVDAEQLLHRPRGQADLATADHAARRDPPLDVVAWIA